MIPRSMRAAGEVLSVCDESWRQFSRTWKKARGESSEKSIHQLRVSTRRLIASLELTRATIYKSEDIARLQRQLKKVLKRMGPLRDIQVQLEHIAAFRETEPIRDFKRSLVRREKSEIDDIRKDLKRRRGRRLAGGMTDLRMRLEEISKTVDDAKIQRSIRRLVTLHRNKFVRARQAYKPDNEESLHEMRIALKKLRYVLESAQPILGEWVKERTDQMHACQQLMGDIRDLQVLKSRLEEWAAKKGKRVAISAILAKLQGKRERLMKRIPKATAAFDEIFPPQIQPLTETTEAVITKAVAVKASA